MKVALQILAVLGLAAVAYASYSDSEMHVLTGHGHGHECPRRVEYVIVERLRTHHEARNICRSFCNGEGRLANITTENLPYIREKVSRAFRGDHEVILWIGAYNGDNYQNSCLSGGFKQQNFTANLRPCDAPFYAICEVYEYDRKDHKDKDHKDKDHKDWDKCPKSCDSDYKSKDHHKDHCKDRSKSDDCDKHDCCRAGPFTVISERMTYEKARGACAGQGMRLADLTRHSIKSVGSLLSTCVRYDWSSECDSKWNSRWDKKSKHRKHSRSSDCESSSESESGKKKSSGRNQDDWKGCMLMGWIRSFNGRDGRDGRKSHDKCLALQAGKRMKDAYVTRVDCDSLAYPICQSYGGMI